MDLKNVDINSLSEKEAMILYDFWNAYNREYPPALTWRQLRDEGFTPKEYTHCGITEIEESLDELDTLSSFHINDEGVVCPGESDRESWIDRRINKWSRTKIWKI